MATTYDSAGITYDSATETYMPAASAPHGGGEWYRLNGEWVRKTGGVIDPPVDPPSGSVNWAGHVPNRVKLGFANADGSNTQLTYEKAITFTGPIYERRKFSPNWVSASYINQWLDTTKAAGQLAWLSFKTPGGNSRSAWQSVVNGNEDAALDIIIARAQARSDLWMVSVDHEPSGSNITNSDLSVWAAMQEYISDYLAGVNTKVCFASISNGFPWGPKLYDQAAINALYPNSLISTFNANKHLMAVDSYDSGDPTKLSYTQYDRTSLKIQGYVDWARTKGVKAIGFGEFGCHTGEDVRRCWNILAANADIIGVANYFNSGANSRANWLLVPSNFKAPNSAFNGTAETQSRLNYFTQALDLSKSANPSQIA